MILHLPYAYEMTCIPPGCMTRKRFDVVDEVAFEIPSVGGADAPLSCRHEGVDRRTFEGRCYVPAGCEVDDLAGLLSTTRRAGEHGREHPFQASAKALFDGPVRFAPQPFGLGTLAETLAAIARDAKRGSAVKDIQDDRTAANAVAAANWAKSILVVDGEPWVAGPEPRYVIHYAGGSGIRMTAGTSTPGDARWSVQLRADRRDDAVRIARELAARVRGRFFIDEVHDDIDLHDAGALAFDEADAMATAMVERCYYHHLVPVRSATGALVDGEALQARRIARDPTWAVDYLEIPGIEGLAVRTCRLPYANDRADFKVGCGINLETWRGLLRDGFVESPDLDADDEIAAFAPR